MNISSSFPEALFIKSSLYLSDTLSLFCSISCLIPLIPATPAIIMYCPASGLILCLFLIPVAVTVTMLPSTLSLTVVCPPDSDTPVTAACLVRPATSSLKRISLALSLIIIQSLATTGTPPAAYILFTAFIRGI